jgi:DNA-binding SARP family transcriptional activator
MLSIMLLGSSQLSRDERLLPVVRRKYRALVYYLAPHPAPVRRERLLTLVWPEHARTAAQHRLWTMLYGLRQMLGLGLESPCHPVGSFVCGDRLPVFGYTACMYPAGGYGSRA